MTRKELKREILSKKQSLTDNELFVSNEYNQFLKDMQDGILSCRVGIDVAVLNSDNNEFVAMTDNKKTLINFNNIYMSMVDNRIDKHKILCALNLHESGHMLFTDFNIFKKQLKLMESGVIYPVIDASLCAELEALLLKPEMPRILTSIYANLDNCIEDGFIDRTMTRLIPGYGSCLVYLDTLDKTMECKTYPEMVADGLSEINIFLNMVLSYARHGKILAEETVQDPVVEEFRKVMRYVEKAVYEASPYLRAKLKMEVMCHLVNFVKVQQQKQQSNNQNQNGQNQSGQQNQSNSGNNTQSQNSQSGQKNDSQTTNPGNSKDGVSSNSPSAPQSGNGASMEELMKLVNEQMKAKASEKADHRNCGSANSEAVKKLQEVGPEKKSATTTPAPSSQEKDPVLSKIAEKVAESKVEQEEERRISNSLNQDIKEFFDKDNANRNISSKIRRASSSDSSGVARYNAEHAALDSIVKRTISEFEKEIKDRQTGDTCMGLYSGKRFEASQAHRFDKRVMSRKILPEDIPDMAVGIMIDLSGSMGGDKITVARQCAYITHSFCTKLGIPCFVIGHYTCGDRVEMVSVADENSIDRNDPIRIFSLQAGGCNRDGYALKYCMEKLKRITAEQKLLMVISDGRPNHQGYGIDSGRKECQAVVKDGIKNGILTIATAIDDAEQVKSVYKKGLSEKNSAAFMDLSDLGRLPKAFVKIIKQKLA